MLRFWDLTTGGELLNYKIDKRRIDALAVSPDGKLVAVSASDSLYLWNWGSGDEPQRIPVGWRVVSLAFSPDGTILAEGPDSRGEIVLRDVKSHKVLRTLADAAKNPMYVTSLAFDVDGRSVVAANAIGLRGREIECRVHAWDVATGTIRQQFGTGDMLASLISVSRDGHWIAASTGSNATVNVWDFRSGKLVSGDVPVHDSTVNSIHLSRDGGTAVTAAQDGTIRIWDANTGRQRHLLRHTYWVRGCALSSDDQWIASSSLDDTVRLWEAGTGKEVYRLPGHGNIGGMRAVAFSADNNRFASWGDDFYLRVWDVKTGKALLEHRVHPPGLTLPEGEDDGDRSDDMDFRLHMDQVTFSADARLLVLVQGQSISTFDVATGELQSTLQNPDGLMTSIHLSPDGTRVATSSWGRPIQTLLADGRTRSSPGKNHTARVLRIPSGEELFRKELPDQGAGPVAYSADGSLLAVASRWPLSGSLIVLDGTTGVELIEFEDLPADARAIGFSADGKKLACGFGDGTALVWNLKIPEKKR
jgi:WD40 repeat protein